MKGEKINNAEAINFFRLALKGMRGKGFLLESPPQSLKLSKYSAS